jgi:hypothetical protein
MLLAQPLTCRPPKEDALCVEPLIVRDGGPIHTAVTTRLERFWNPLYLIHQTGDELWASLGTWDLYSPTTYARKAVL